MWIGRSRVGVIGALRGKTWHSSSAGQGEYNLKVPTAPNNKETLWVSGTHKFLSKVCPKLPWRSCNLSNDSSLEIQESLDHLSGMNTVLKHLKCRSKSCQNVMIWITRGRREAATDASEHARSWHHADKMRLGEKNISTPVVPEATGSWESSIIAFPAC